MSEDETRDSKNALAVCHVLVVLDGCTEDVVHAIRLPRFDLALFCDQFDVPVETDPEMHDRYVVGPDDEEFLRQYLDEPVVFDFTAKGYWIEAATL
jgi:hypothetical protein